MTWPTWNWLRALLDLDEAAVAEARAELEAEQAAYQAAHPDEKEAPDATP